MVVDIKMCRFDNVPWGFRLVGGADYDYPLTVVKVNEGSIAEEAGLRVDDVIVRINDTPAMPLTHDQANYLIIKSGSVFFFGVYREGQEEEERLLMLENPGKFPVSCPSAAEKEQQQEQPMESMESLKTMTSAVEMPEVAVDEPQSVPLAMSEVQSEEVGCSGGSSGNGGGLEEALYLPGDLPDRPCSALSEQTEIKLVEEEIAAVLSGESEVLKEHNVLGIFPKPGVCMTSDVLRSLNEEVTKTKLEKEQENRKWSTFLQKPNRPVPKSKQALEAERRAANAYKVQIVKSAPRDKSPMPEAKPVPSKEPSPSPPPPPPKEPESVQEVEVEDEEPLPEDSELPNLEQLENGNCSEPSTNDEQSINSNNHNDNNNNNNNVNDDEQVEKTDTPKDESEDEQQQQQQQQEQEPPTATLSPTSEGEQPPLLPPPAPKTEEELALEKQLNDVQKQLAALSSLPSTIQSTLDAVTKQLAELLPAFKLQQPPAGDTTTTNATNPTIDERPSYDSAVGEFSAVDNGSEVGQTGAYENADAALDKCDASDLEVAQISCSNADNRESVVPRRADGGDGDDDGEQQLSEEQSFKRQKKHDVIEELEEHLVRKSNPKRSKRAFGPLTPSSERPLVLPGGRRWYRPKDAYNDEFIAETLSSQAELITGTTLGCPYESSLLGYDSRQLQGLSLATQKVNFMKYQKPERKIDLNRSEVYKVIHHLDRAPVRGIEVRAPMVAAESDIRQSVQS